MAILVILLFFVESIITPKLVIAISPPTQISPINNTTVSSSKLEWETPVYSIYSNDPYRIQVDNDLDFSSVYRDYKTKNTFYTPILTEGEWYWKIKAKDASGMWSDWSTTWSFNLTSSPTSTPTPLPTQTPIPSASSITSSSSTSLYTISNTPSEINSYQTFTVSVNLSLPGSPNSTFYLKGAFKKADSSNYFGLTRVSGSWIKNGSSYSNQYPITTDSTGNYSGNLEVQVDSEDSGFSGSSEYIFKVGRYTSTGSGPTWSNESTIKITDFSESQSESISDVTPTHTPSIASSKNISSKSIVAPSVKISSIAGASKPATPSLTPKSLVQSQKQINFLSIIGSILVIIGVIPITYAIYNKFRKRNEESS